MKSIIGFIFPMWGCGAHDFCGISLQVLDIRAVYPTPDSRHDAGSSSGSRYQLTSFIGFRESHYFAFVRQEEEFHSMWFLIDDSRVKALGNFQAAMEFCINTAVKVSIIMFERPI